AYFCVRQRLADRARGLDVIDRVAVVFLDSGGNGEDVRIEYDVLDRKPDFLYQQMVGAGADLDAPRQGIGLAFLVEGHDDRRSTVAPYQTRLAQELSLPFLHADRVHYALALYAFQSCLDDLPFGRIDHDRYARDVRFGADQIQEGHHLLLRIQHRLVHVDIDDLRSFLELSGGHRERIAIVTGEDQTGEGLRAGDVGAFADVHEQRVFGDVERLQPGKPEFLVDCRDLARRHILQRLDDRLDVRRRGPAASAG